MTIYWQKPFLALTLSLTLISGIECMADAQNMNDTLLAPPTAMSAESASVPAGHALKVVFVTPIDSKTARVGDSFIAQTPEDFWSQDRLLLPKGTVFRGRVETVQKPGIFSKGGLLRLSFDHTVLPTGEIEPIQLTLDTNSPQFSHAKNALYTDPGVGAKLNQSVDKGVAQYKTLHEKGVKAGEYYGGPAKFLTVPGAAIAGVATGTAVTTGNAVKALFGMGDSVTIQPGDEMIIDFAQATTLQAQ